MHVVQALNLRPYLSTEVVILGNIVRAAFGGGG